MAYKVYSTNYLMKLTKAEIIDILRTAEHNYIATEEALTRSADYGKGLLKEIEQLKKADVQPVRRGKWDFQGNQLFKCTNCNEIFSQEQLESIRKSFPNYCPNCGAEMLSDTDAGEIANCIEFKRRMKR